MRILVAGAGNVFLGVDGFGVAVEPVLELLRQPTTTVPAGTGHEEERTC